MAIRVAPLDDNLDFPEPVRQRQDARLAVSLATPGNPLNEAIGRLLPTAKEVTNLDFNPGAEYPGGTTPTAGSSAAIASSEAWSVSGTRSWACTANVTSAATVEMPAAARAAASAGGKFTTKVTIRNQAATARRFAIGVRFRTSTGTITDQATANQELAPGAQGTFEFTGVAPADTATATWLVNRTSYQGAIGDVFHLDNIYFGAGPEAPATPADGDQTNYEWTGTPGASPSKGKLGSPLSFGGMIHAPLNAERYGAAPTKTATENRNAIQAMINDLPAMGGDMKLGSGSVTVAGGIQLPSNKPGTFTGAGDGTRLVLAPGANTDMFVATGAFPSTNPGGPGEYANWKNNDYLTVADMFLVGNKANQTALSVGMKLTGIDFLRVERITFTDWHSHALWLTGCDEGTLHNLFFNGNGATSAAAGILLSGASHDFGISDCYFENNQDAIRSTTGYESSISNCNFWGNQIDINLQGDQNVDWSISNVLTEKALGAGSIMSIGAKRVSIDHVHVMDAVGDAIRLQDTVDTTVSNSHIAGGARGIRELGSSDRNWVHHNLIDPPSYANRTVTPLAKLGANSVFGPNMVSGVLVP